MSSPPLSVLWIEPTFPGRLGAVADWLVRRRGYRCRFYCGSADDPATWPASTGNGLEVIRYDLRGAAAEPGVSWQRLVERGLMHANGAFQVLDSRRPRPLDLIIGRSQGLGSTLFAPVAAPGVPIVNFFDYFVQPRTNDLSAEATASEVYFHWRRSANAVDLLDLENGVVPWIPTHWQRELYPNEYRDEFTVMFDGVDGIGVRGQGSGVSGRTIAGRVVPEGAKVVTFAARSLGRVRGYDRFVAIADRLLRERSDVIVVIAGDSRVHHGIDPEYYLQDYPAWLAARQPWSDPSRVWQLGAVSRSVLAELFAVSDLHLYPSRVYPVSRSLIEAMGAGCLVMATDTPPVREFISDIVVDSLRESTSARGASGPLWGATGLLFSPDDIDTAVSLANSALADPAAYQPLREAAAALVRERYDREVVMPRLADWFASIALGGR